MQYIVYSVFDNVEGLTEGRHSMYAGGARIQEVVGTGHSGEYMREMEALIHFLSLKSTMYKGFLYTSCFLLYNKILTMVNLKTRPPHTLCTGDHHCFCLTSPLLEYYTCGPSWQKLSQLTTKLTSPTRQVTQYTTHKVSGDHMDCKKRIRRPHGYQTQLNHN